MKRVVLFSYHYANSKRRAGFHQLADAYRHLGWDVVFVTTPVSWMSWLRRDPRFAYPLIREANRARRLADGLTSYVLFTNTHPASLRNEALNRLSARFFERYGQSDLGALRGLLAEADLVIVEPGPGLLLVEQIRRHAPHARLVYRVSDDLRALGHHPVVLQREVAVAPSFDLISAPSLPLHRRFAHLQAAHLHPHAVRKDLFAAASVNPYGRSKNAVFVGAGFFDPRVIPAMAKHVPDWRFHVIGPLGGLIPLPNVFVYGELPFAETIPFIKYADVGLNTLAPGPAAEVFCASLKVVQYTYCRLPIVAPDFLRQPGWDHVFHYAPAAPETAADALRAASGFDRSTISTDGIGDWDDLARTLAGADPAARTC